ncbi:hypothetical protein EGW08_005990 [Elysia chlorotica]|uniref:BZIP domain-containing protein n=1 Tax=Elysia chlorotica TaxID=188477 RepID=A0A3S1BQG2_ELYCH|nr:hypothetical protein EGW08_005990 [Elysia chlorotica]
MEEEQDDMPFVCSVADCGMRFINEDHLNWHSKKHEMSLALNTGGQTSSSPAHPNFLDQTPTPTKFLKNCEEIGLYQELTPNPFDHAYKQALDDPTAPIPGPPTSGGELNTPTLILSDDHSKASSSAPSPLSLEKPTLLLKGAEPLRPSPLAVQATRPASVVTATTVSPAKTLPVQQLSTAMVTTATNVPLVTGLVSSADQLRQFSTAQNKLMLDLSGRSVMTEGHSQLLAVAPTTKVATVQPLVVQNTSSGLREQLTREGTTLQSNRFVSSSSSTASNLGVLKHIKSEHLESEDTDSAGNATQQQQQQCTMQVLLQLPTGETVPISIPATINKLQYLGPTQLQQHLQQQQQPQQQTQAQSGLPKLSPAPSTTSTPVNQTTTIKQRLKAQLQSQLSPTAKAGIHGETGLGTVLHEQQGSSTSAFNTVASTPASSMVDSTSPIMMLDSPNSEMNLSDSSDYSIDSKRQKLSPDTADPDERRRKFLERNRAAAARCRQKRKHWISNLEKKADELQNTNSKLQNEVKLLRGEVAQLKTLLIAHKDCPVTQQQKSQGQLQHVILPDLQAQVVPTADSDQGSALHLGQIVTILQPDAGSLGSRSNSLQGT